MILTLNAPTSFQKVAVESKRRCPLTHLRTLLAIGQPVPWESNNNRAEKKQSRRTGYYNTVCADEYEIT